MKITLQVKAENHAPVQIGPFDLSPEDIKRLRDDYESYVLHGTPRGGAYNHLDGSNPKAVLMIAFDQIVVIH